MFNSQNDKIGGYTMGALSNRLNAVKYNKPTVMYSVVGAMWQESAIARIDYKGSPAHMSVGNLVTAINNNLITVEEAESSFTMLLNKGKA